MLNKLTDKILQGEYITAAEAIQLAQTTDKEALYAAAARITKHFMGNKFDTCSIINAKSGNCPEDCKWCAQSAHHAAKIDLYPLLDTAECVRQAQYNAMQGIGRFSLVTSGRTVSDKTLERICETIKAIKASSKIKCCASLGLLKKSQLEKLKACGVENYHCNIETAPSFFATLCSTHTQEDKWKTLHAAKEIGMRLCCGGIIGMGETLEQRIEMGYLLQQENILSIPINLLNPIPGTPLANVPPLSEDEILLTIALFRFLNPQAYLRFSGGRALLSEEAQRKALFIGTNAAIMGDLLTTIGSSVERDITLFTEAGYTLTADTDWV